MVSAAASTSSPGGSFTGRMRLPVPSSGPAGSWRTPLEEADVDVRAKRVDAGEGRVLQRNQCTLSEAVPVLFPLLARIVVLPSFLAVTTPLFVEFPIKATDLGVTVHFIWDVTSRTVPPEK